MIGEELGCIFLLKPEDLGNLFWKRRLEMSKPQVSYLQNSNIFAGLRLELSPVQ